jgi:hypothetical protein
MLLPNETVEKPILERAFPIRDPTEGPNSLVADSLRSFSLCQGLVDRPIRVDLADIVYQSK